MNDNQIDTLLRRPPRPPTPAGLKERLLQDIPPQPYSAQTNRSAPPTTPRRRWFPALSFGCLLFGCLVVLGTQMSRLLQLRAERDQLRAIVAELPQLRRENAELRSLQKQITQAEMARRDYQELLALRTEAEQLRQQNQIAETLRAENDQLKTAAAKAKAAARQTQTPDPFGDALNRAQIRECISNLKRIGLAARIWANDHGGQLPPDFATMTNELVNPKILFCPAADVHTLPTTWDRFNFSSASYKTFSLPALISALPQDAILTQCPIHNHFGSPDGSVQRVDPNAGWKLVTKDGVTRLIPPTFK